MANGLVNRYVQNHVQAEEFHPHGEATKFYDVIDELWFTDLAALSRLGEGRNAAAVRAVEGELLDGSRTRAFVATMFESIP